MEKQQNKLAALTETEETLASTLYQAYTTNKPLDVTDWSTKVSDEESAYRVQNRLMELKNETVGGYKISLTSEETQKMFNSNSPLYGAQVESRFLHSPASFALNNMLEPLVEVELAFRVDKDLNVEDDLEQLMQKTSVAGALEVPDCRFKDWFPSLEKNLVVSDAAVGGLVVVGDLFPTTVVFESVKAVAAVHCNLKFNNESLKKGTSSEVLGNPLKSLQWLVVKLQQHGKQLTAGQYVSTGTFVLPPKLQEGTWSAHFNNGLGDVKLNVTK
ncbi:2-keto-4-pentenoate hydratase [Lactobacillus sp. UCMA15818]|uniref:2-keto-4-pentenoate hydratase n=1 Tax=Lactobacillus sp. UCMA15818 TaxID=2583394 RepID=UPI0025B1F8AD|nr:2-keto-4-pentenoate hydratase [Lactobacillus sp. UCMA15818]MDN2452379.1 2-keto-4-pentenoate hydratase [Lactobacillus sp. UCMA15818]